MDKEGNCFKVAADLVLESGGLDCELVHGVVVGLGKLKGQRFVHGWVEIAGVVVVDGSIGKYALTSVGLYYKLGQIIDEEVVRYSIRETRELVLETQNYGPWAEFYNVVG